MFVGLQAAPSNPCGFHVHLTGNSAVAPPASIIQFNKVVTNVGDWWDDLSKMFTAPVRGLYVFHLHVVQYRTHTSNVLAHIMHEMKSATMVYVWKTVNYGTESASVVLELEARHRVYCRLTHGILYGTTDGITSFTGYLLYPLD